MSGKNTKISIKPAENPQYSVLDQLCRATLAQQIATSDLSDNIVKRAIATEEVAKNSMVTLDKQGQQLSHLDSKMDGLQHSINSATRDANYLKNLDRSMFMPAVAPKPLTPARISEIKFASTAPKDASGKPVAAPRKSSLPASPARESTSTFRADMLDESATDEQRARSRAAEENIDKNMNIVSGVVSRLKDAAIHMGQAVDQQNETVEHIQGKVDTSQTSLNKLNGNVNGLMNKRKK